MSDHKEHPLLVEVATTIADGLRLDWDTLLAEHPDLSEELEELRVLEGVERARQRGERQGRQTEG